MSEYSSATAFVYFISAGSGPIKIGVSDDPQSRLNTLQTAHYKRLHLLFTIACPSRNEAFLLEKAFHRWYGESQLINEWFDVSPGKIEADINLLQSLSRIQAQFESHISPSVIARMVEKATLRSGPKGTELRRDDGRLHGYVCPGCGKSLSISGWSRHKKVCESIRQLHEVEVE